ncbi:hypothetical protein ACFL1R_07485 [Candidatus Latescibacterota bacterium]
MIILLVFFILLFSGCDTDSDKSVTSAFFDKEPGSLERLALGTDSLHIGNSYHNVLGISSYALAGKYENISAFSVFKFLPEAIYTDSLVSASLKLEVQNIWGLGSIEFELFETFTDWSDTTLVDPDSFLTGLGNPVATLSDTSTSSTVLTFDLDPEIIRQWPGKGAFLLKNSDAGMAIASIYSDNSLYRPALILEILTATGATDTSQVKCIEGTYYIDTGFNDANSLLSEGYAAGFVLDIGIPESLPPMAVVNRCVLKMRALERFIPDIPMFVKVYKLENAFTSIDAVEADTFLALEINIVPDLEIYSLDITSYVNSWHIGGDTNYGLLFKVEEEIVSPNQCLFVPADSLIITYTNLPEID